MVEWWWTLIYHQICLTAVEISVECGGGSEETEGERERRAEFFDTPPSDTMCTISSNFR
jgi:hypothetical protein